MNKQLEKEVMPCHVIENQDICLKGAVCSQVQGVSPASLALRQVIEEALETPGFLEQGGTLAFGCQHAYPHNSDAFLKTDFKPQLKGADACLFAVAEDLGLSVDVQAIYKDPEDNYR